MFTVILCDFGEFFEYLINLYNRSFVEKQYEYDNEVYPLPAYQTGLFVILMCIGLIGNSLIIAFFINRNKRDLKKMPGYEFMLLILAITEGFYCITIPCHIATNLRKMVELPRSILLDFSVLLLVPLAYMRYIGIVDPIHTNRERKWSKKFCGFILILCLGFASITGIPAIELLSKWTGTSFINLWENRTKLLILKSCLLFVMYVTPCCILAVIYRLISNHLNTDEAIQTQPEIKARHETTLRVLRFLSIAAFLAIVPMRVVIIVVDAVNFYACLNQSSISYQLSGVLDIFAVSNSTVNVFIYAHAVSDFRQFLINLLKCGSKTARTKEEGKEKRVKPVELETGYVNQAVEHC